MSQSTIPIERQQAIRSIAEKLESRTIDAPPHLQQLERYVRRHRCWRVRHHEIADRVGLLPTQFSALFLARVGMSFSHWMTVVRIKHAIDMLSRHNVPIVELGKHVGYRDCGTFRRAFKRVTGFLPSEARQVLKPRKTR